MENKKPYGYWDTKENCAKEALKYDKRIDFQKGCKSAYNKARTNKWLDEVCRHMIPQGNLERRYIYKATFPDGAIYIGLTYNQKRRFRDHLSDENSSVYRYKIKTNLEPTIELINNTLYPKEEASELEDFIVEEYKRYGYNVLNRIKAGMFRRGKNIKMDIRGIN